MKLDYTVDLNDPIIQQGLDETANGAPDPKVIQDLQATLQRVMQPQPLKQKAAQPTAAQANANWGEAVNA